jgi:hypothetical protein
MSDDEDNQVDSESNMFDGNEGSDGMGFGPLMLTEGERSLVERVRQELKHELKQVMLKHFVFLAVIHCCLSKNFQLSGVQRQTCGYSGRDIAEAKSWETPWRHCFYLKSMVAGSF